MLDLLGRSAREETEAVPTQATRTWLAGRLGASESGIAKALGQLSTAHPGDDTTPASPVYVHSVQRGRGRSALRTTVPGVPYVEVPEWTLGDPVNGTLLATHAVWRFYVLVLYLRHRRYSTVALKRSELAAIAGVRDESVTKLTRQAQQAGLLVAVARPGRETVLAPVTLPTRPDAAELDRLAAAAVKSWAPKPAEPAGPHPSAGTAPDPSTGTAGDPSAGTAPHPSTGTANKRVPSYGDPSYEDPAPACAAPTGRTRPEQDPDAGRGEPPGSDASVVQVDWRKRADPQQIAASTRSGRALAESLLPPHLRRGYAAAS